MVTLQNYEEYIMLYVDDELDAASEKELMLFLEEHPELKKELALYQKTKLSPVSEMIFAGKDQLIRQPAKKIQFNRWLLYAVAASILLLVALVTGKWMNKPAATTTDLPQVAVSNTDSVARIPPTVATSDTVARPSMPATQPAEKPAPSLAATQKEPSRKKTPQPATPAPKTPVSYENEEQEPEVEVVKTDDHTAGELKEPAMEEPQAETATEKKKRKRSLLALLPISHEKKEGLNHLKNTMQDKVETVKNIQEEIKNTSLEVKLGNKELFVINL